MDLKDIYYSIEDSCWSLLETIGLADFFDDHGIPAVVFPLLIILLLIGLLYLVLAVSNSNGGAGTCGDGICQAGEDCQSDCHGADGSGKGAASQKTLERSRLEVGLRGAGCDFTITIKDLDDNILSQRRGSKDRIVFNGIRKNKIKVEVTTKNGKTQKFGTMNIPRSRKISLTLGRDLCKNSQYSAPVYATLEVSVKDSSTQRPVTAIVSLMDIETGQAIERQEGSSLLFNPRASKRYFLVARANGFFTYEGSKDAFYIRPGERLSKTLSLRPVAGASENPKGKVIVCVTNEDGPLNEGLVSLFTSDGEQIYEGDLRDCYIKGSGCYSFDNIDAGLNVYATGTSFPGLCVEGEKSEVVTVRDGKTSSINLKVRCTSVAEMNVIVRNSSGAVLTEMTDVVILQDGKIIKGPLSVYNDGYTERTIVPAGERITVRAVPSQELVEYVTTEKKVKIDPGNLTTVEIKLNRNGALNRLPDNTTECGAMGGVCTTENQCTEPSGFVATGQMGCTAGLVCCLPSVTDQSSASPPETGFGIGIKLSHNPVSIFDSFYAIIKAVNNSVDLRDNEDLAINCTYNNKTVDAVYEDGSWRCSFVAPGEETSMELVVEGEFGNETASNSLGVKTAYPHFEITSLETTPSVGEVGEEFTVGSVVSFNEGTSESALSKYLAELNVSCWRGNNETAAVLLDKSFEEGDFGFECSFVPDEVGNYPIEVRAVLYGIQHSDSIEVTVKQHVGNSLRIRTRKDIHKTSPVMLGYLVEFRESGEPVTELSDSNVTFVLTSSGNGVEHAYSETSKLPRRPSNRMYSLSQDLYFAGDYRVDVYVEKEVDNVVYTGRKSHRFRLRKPSHVTFKTELLPDLVEPDGIIDEDIYAIMEIDDIRLSNFTVFLEINGTAILLPYDPENGMRYKRESIPVASFGLKEGAYNALFYVAEDPTISDDSHKLYVVDTSQCPQGCSDKCPPPEECRRIADVRKCKADFDSGDRQVSEDRVKQCAENFFSGASLEGLCESHLVGDIDGNGKVDSKDLVPIHDFIEGDYEFEDIACADINRDGSIDMKDMRCIAGMIELGKRGCVSDLPQDCLNAYSTTGFCSSHSGGEEIKGDINSDGVVDSNDLFLMELALSKKLDSKDILKCADMNGDGFITSSDKACLQMQVDFDPDQLWELTELCSQTCTPLPEMVDLCDDGVDNDCDGVVDDGECGEGRCVKEISTVMHSGFTLYCEAHCGIQNPGSYTCPSYMEPSYVNVTAKSKFPWPDLGRYDLTKIGPNTWTWCWFGGESCNAEQMLGKASSVATYIALVVEKKGDEYTVKFDGDDSSGKGSGGRIGGVTFDIYCSVPIESFD